jgi:dolichol kinase
VIYKLKLCDVSNRNFNSTFCQKMIIIIIILLFFCVDTLISITGSYQAHLGVQGGRSMPTLFVFFLIFILSSYFNYAFLFPPLLLA